jgi:hypothetical protein
MAVFMTTVMRISYLTSKFHFAKIKFSLFHIVDTALDANPASYPIGAWASFSGGKAAGV